MILGNVDRSEILTKIWAVYEAGDFITVCAWCGSLEIEGEWIGPEPGLLSTFDQPMTVSHSICRRCEQAVPTIPPG
jgi:hypothetical protein